VIINDIFGLPAFHAGRSSIHIGRDRVFIVHATCRKSLEYLSPHTLLDVAGESFDTRIGAENFSDKDASRLHPMFTRAFCIVLKV
jgi:hypothetical protein